MTNLSRGTTFEQVSLLLKIHNMKIVRNITRKLGDALKIAGATTLLLASANNGIAQEKYGNTLNLGLGSAYFDYIGGSSLYLTGNYEFDVAKSFTLAPFVGFTSFRSNNYYGNHYYYHQTVIPIGVKGTYYFDKILGAGPNWDFYLGASLGFNIEHITWDDGYTGDRGAYHNATPLYLTLHAGTEYHFNKKLGIFLDLSTGVSTIGLAIHNR